MITETIFFFFVAGPVKMLSGQVKMCTTGPTGTGEKILSVDPCFNFQAQNLKYGFPILLGLPSFPRKDVLGLSADFGGDTFAEMKDCWFIVLL